MSWHCFGEETVTAKKPHQCILCDREIAAGSKYLHRTGVDDRHFISMKMHPACEALTHDWDAMDWETFSPGDLAQWIDEPLPELEPASEGQP